MIAQLFDSQSSPLAPVGYLALLVALLLSAFSLAASLRGQRQGQPSLIAGALHALDAVAALLTVALCLLVYSLLANDFGLRYVARYGGFATPLVYKLTACWGGLEGSLLFWVWLLTVLASTALHLNRRQHGELAGFGYAVAVVAAVTTFFLGLLVYSKDPFATFFARRPGDGQGLNPLLESFWMATHPPALYLGYVGMTIPYAFCMAALAAGRLDNAWLRAARPWMLFSWLWLTVGLVLGMIWAYEELGWGGYWAWDPVENAGLLPWLTATAFLHSAAVQRRRGAFKVWNVALAILTFFLTIFGTFMTRSGLFESVHAFGRDNELAVLFLLFMGLVLVVSFGLMVYRLPLLRSTRGIDSVFSREAALLALCWLLSLAALFVTVATVFPTVAEMGTGNRPVITPALFNKWMAPAGLTVLVLLLLGTAVGWGAFSRARQWKLAAPLLGVLPAVGTVAYARTCGFPALPHVGLWLVAINALVLGLELIDNMVQRGSGRLKAKLGRRQGGIFLAHLGFAVMLAGFAVSSLSQEKQVSDVAPGQSFSFGANSFRYHGLAAFTTDGGREVVGAKVTLANEDWRVAFLAAMGRRQIEEVGERHPAEENVQAARMEPSRWRNRRGSQQTVSEVAIRRGLLADVYLALDGYDLETSRASFTVCVNPGVSWVWIGFLVMILGALFCIGRVSGSTSTRSSPGSEESASPSISSDSPNSSTSPTSPSRPNVRYLLGGLLLMGGGGVLVLWHYRFRPTCAVLPLIVGWGALLLFAVLLVRAVFSTASQKRMPNETNAAR
ncbi:MAG: cytochrome c biogenesis protein CcsA [Pseudomonadota bacterium]